MSETTFVIVVHYEGEHTRRFLWKLQRDIEFAVRHRITMETRAGTGATAGFTIEKRVSDQT